MNHHFPVASDDETLASTHFDPHARLRGTPNDGRHASVTGYQTTCPSIVGVTPRRGDREWSEGA
ncbi:hypothetical protein WMF37_33150 [Sorangium sp. So ce291]|uniref:hypothetical protein n=1 Tax=Sorangium sp. So ce291 TaxID=3133294 RepID=UPI003F634C9D